MADVISTQFSGETRRVGAFSTTRSTAVLMYERSRPFDSWERTSKGEKTTDRIASSVNACLNPRRRLRNISGPFVPSGSFRRRNLSADMADSLASLNNVKTPRLVARTPQSRYMAR